MINEHVERPDYWFVYSKGADKEERSIIPRSNVVFIAGEPEYIYSYSKKFLMEFGLLVGPRDDLSQYSGIFKRSYPAQTWLVGRNFKINDDIQTAEYLNWCYFNNHEKKTYDDKISVVVSNKTLCSGHVQRNCFVRKLVDHFGDKLDVFGGEKPFSDKWDAVENYKYHIAVENGAINDYWTEKISDPFLAECFVFYAGCRNIGDYFDMGSVSILDLDDFWGSVKRIETLLANDAFGNSTVARSVNKNLILQKYNLIQLIQNVIEEIPTGGNAEEVVIPREKIGRDLGKINMKIKYNLYNRIIGKIA